MTITPEQYSQLKGRSALLFEYHTWMNSNITTQMKMRVMLDNFPGSLSHAQIIQRTHADVVPLHIDEYVDIDQLLDLEHPKRKKAIALLRYSNGATKDLGPQYRRVMEAGLLYVYLGTTDFFDNLATAFYKSMFEL